MTEYELKQTLLDRLQSFMLERGREYCLIARALRVVGSEAGDSIDLVFFHRNLGCLVAADLKLGEFRSEYLLQLHFHLNYLARRIVRTDENPPVGILLCADPEAEVVRLVMPSNDPHLVCRCQLELPGASQLRKWLHEERGRILQGARSDTMAPKTALG
jgi:nuclease YhcG-like protein